VVQIISNKISNAWSCAEDQILEDKNLREIIFKYLYWTISKKLSSNLFTCKGTYITDWVGRLPCNHLPCFWKNRSMLFVCFILAPDCTHQLLSLHSSTIILALINYYPCTHQLLSLHSSTIIPQPPWHFPFYFTFYFTTSTQFLKRAPCLFSKVRCV